MADNKKINILIDVVSETALRGAKKVEDSIKGIGETASKTSKKRLSEEEKAAKEVERIHQQTAKSAERFARQQEQLEDRLFKQGVTNANRAAKQKADAAKQALDEYTRSVNKAESETKKVAANSQSAFSSAFSGGFLGSLAGNISTYFIGKLQQIPDKIREIYDEAVKISQERANAFAGLESVATFRGIDEKAAKDAVNSLRLVKAGILDVGDATTGLKNLLSTGFSLPQAVKIMERFSDAAAFGKQSALTYGEAISRAAEGIKNQNSNLVDNVGLTKNLSVILEERGFKLDDLTDKTKKQAALEALYKGVLAETTAQIGDADKLTSNYTGSVAGLENAQKNLYATIGDFITQSPLVIAAYRIQKGQVEDLTSSLADQGTETQKTALKWIEAYAKIKAGTLPFLATMTNAFMSALYAIKGIALSVVVTFEAATEGLMTASLSALNLIYEPIRNIYNKIQEYAGGESRLPELQTNYIGDQSFKTIELIKGAFDDASKSWEKMKTSGKEFAAAVDDVDTYVRAIREDLAKAKEKTTTKKTSGEDSGGSGKTKKTPLSSEERRTRSILNEMQEFAREQGFVPGSGYRPGKQINKGSIHGEGRALDVSLNANANKTVEDWTRYVVAAMEKGYRVVDERLLKYHKGVTSTGKNVHIEKGQGIKESLFLPQSFYSVPVEYLKYLDEQRRNRKGAGGVSQDEIDRFNKQTKENLEKQEKLNIALTVLQNAQAIYGKDAIKIPETVDEILDAYKELKTAVRQRIVKDTSTRPRYAGDSTGSDVPLPLRKDENGNYILPDDQLGSYNSDGQRTRNDRQNIRDYNSINESLQDQLSDLQRGNKSLSVYEETLRDINRNYQDLDEEKKKDLLNTAAQIDATNNFLKTQEKVKGYFESLFDNAFSGKFKSILDDMLGNAKHFLAKLAAEFATSKVMEFLTGKGLTGNAPSQQSGGILSTLRQTLGMSGFNLSSLTGGFAGGASPAASITPTSSASNAGLNRMLGGLGLPPILSGGPSTAGAASAGGTAGLAALATNPVTLAAASTFNPITLAVTAFQLMNSNKKTKSWSFGILGKLLGYGKDDSLKKLHDAAFSAYSVDIKDNSVLDLLKQIGTAHFGNASKYAAQTVRLDDAKSAIRDYATQIGASTSKFGISKTDLQNENWSGNRFVSRFGGMREFVKYLRISDDQMNEQKILRFKIRSTLDILSDAGLLQRCPVKIIALNY